MQGKIIKNYGTVVENYGYIEENEIEEIKEDLSNKIEITPELKTCHQYQTSCIEICDNPKEYCVFTGIGTSLEHACGC